MIDYQSNVSPTPGGVKPDHPLMKHVSWHLRLTVTHFATHTKIMVGIDKETFLPPVSTVHHFFSLHLA